MENESEIYEPDEDAFRFRMEILMIFLRSENPMNHMISKFVRMNIEHTFEHTYFLHKK